LTLAKRRILISPLLSGLFLLLSAESVRAATLGPQPAGSVIEDSIPELGRVAHSPEQLIRNALARLKEKDGRGLGLMLPDPKLMMSIYLGTTEGKAANEGQRNFGREFYYLDNNKLLGRRLSRDGGKNLELVSWKPASPAIEVEGGGQILRDIDIQVMDWTLKRTRRLYFVRSIYVSPRGCKIWGFSDDKSGNGVKD
jgi:hypothetical protein